MTIGVSFPILPEQSAPRFALALDDSYFLVKLHEAQAYFSAGRFIKPRYLLMSSSIENSFHPSAPPVQSLHQINLFSNNVPCHLGLSFNLTDWLPARVTDWLRIKLEYTIIQDSPIKDLMDKIGKSGLTARLSTISAEFAVAVKVSEIVSRLLSALTGEGSKRQPFSLEMELSPSTLQTGYQVVFGSKDSLHWPEALRIDAGGRLSDKRNRSLEQYSYIVVEVQSIKRRGSEAMRGRAWWELLQTAKETALATEVANAHQRYTILNYWKHLLDRVRQQAREEQEILLTEIDDVIRVAHLEVMTKLQPTDREALGAVELPFDWQELLSVRTTKELEDAVRFYEDAVRTSQQALKDFEREGG